MSTLSSTPATRTTTADPPYAWIMLPLAIVMHMGTSPGQTYCISVFNASFRESLSLSHSQLSGSYLVASLMAAVPLMFIGTLMDRFGLRRVSLLLVALVGLASLAISLVQGLVGLTLCFFLLRAFGQAGLSMAATNTVAMWFLKRLGVAVGIAGLGISAAIAVLPMLYLFLIQELGWRLAYASIGGATLLALLPLLAVLYRNNETWLEDDKPLNEADESPADTTPQQVASLDRAGAMQTASYWISGTCISLLAMVLTGVFFNITSLFEARGLSAEQAAASYTTVAIAMALLQIKGGVLADWLPLRLLMAVSMASLAGGVLMIAGMQSMLGAQIAAALLGGGQGLLTATANTLWPRYFGRRHLGAIRSTVGTAAIAACAIGPFIMGVTKDWLGDYRPAMAVFAALLVAAAVATIWATPPNRSTSAPLAAAG